MFCLPLSNVTSIFHQDAVQMEPRAMLHALATFLLLSYTKFSLVSFILLIPTPLLKHGSTVRRVLYYDGTTGLHLGRGVTGGESIGENLMGGRM